MILFAHEIKGSWKSLFIWSGVIGGMILLCMLLYPQLSKEVEALETTLKNMGGVTAAFGMDRLNYGELMGFYGIYGGSMLGIGGIFYAAVLGAGMLAKEERDHTAEFLLTHPIGRNRVYFEKAAAMTVEMLLLNALVIACSLVSFLVIGETPEWKTFWLYHLAQVLMQLEILCICYGISAFLRGGGASVGLGIAALVYFLGLFGNISEEAEAVKYITPYSYGDAAGIIPEGRLDTGLIVLGMVYALFGFLAGLWKYRRKDIAA